MIKRLNGILFSVCSVLLLFNNETLTDYYIVVQYCIIIIYWYYTGIIINKPQKMFENIWLLLYFIVLLNL